MPATYPATTLAQSVDLIEQDVNIFHDILNGDVNTSVTIDSGTVPSVSKALSEMAAYKAPIAWSQGTDETDILQPRTFGGNTYVPITTPAPQDASPDSAYWKLYSYVLSEVDQANINQTAGDTEAVVMRWDTLAHGMTAIPSDGDDSAYGIIDKINTGNGGVKILGMGTSTRGASIEGAATAPTTSQTGAGVVEARAMKRSATSITDLAATEIAFSVANNNTRIITVDGEGDLYCAGDIEAVGNVSGGASDKRLKENVLPIMDAVDKVKRLFGITFDFNELGQELGLPAERQTGVFYQDMAEVLPEATKPFAGDPTYGSVMEGKSIGLLVEAIKELAYRVEELENGSKDNR